MSSSWTPSKHVFEQLEKTRAIPAEFSEDQLLDFTTFHSGTTLRQGAFDSKFLRHVIHCWGTRATAAEPLPQSWEPDASTRQRLLAASVPVDFIWQQATEFAMYWHERGTPGYGWNAKFYRQCLEQHNRAVSNALALPMERSAAGVVQRMTDRSWATGG